MHDVLAFQIAGYFLLGSAAIYTVLALIGVIRRASLRAAAAPALPVTVLKPLCGDEPRLYDNLRSFCEQDHPQFQLLFGTREGDDPALIVARRLQSEYPQHDIQIVSDPQVHGINLKISNLLNLMPHAKHDRIVLADSDIAAAPDYLRAVTAPLARAEVGLVTCLYRGRPVGGLWSRLGTQFIDDWFRPSVALSQLFGARRFGFGATLALRRDALAAIGGLESVSNLVADDYWLGEFVADAGFETVLSEHEVATDVTETRFIDLFRRELRWLRTIRSVRPGSYIGTGICFTLPVVLAGIILTGFAAPGLVLAALAVACRTLIFLDAQRRGASLRELPANLMAFALRDLLSLFIWAWAFRGAKVSWRGQQMDVDSPAPARAS